MSTYAEDLAEMAEVALIVESEKAHPYGRAADEAAQDWARKFLGLPPVKRAVKRGPSSAKRAALRKKRKGKKQKR